MPNLMGKDGRLFSEQQAGMDEVKFQVDNTSQSYYNSPYYLQHKDQILRFPGPTVRPPHMNLADVLDDSFVQAIQTANKILFHSVGDTGAAKSSGPATEASVADMMAADVHNGGLDAPAFFFHLGDVIYYFGESQYYYDQFYEPYRAYDRPIFAIPGNHDGVLHDPSGQTLQAFLQNFCAPQPGHSTNAGGLVRTVMTQPGVYFTLDAPFVSIIGLYTNVLEGPGVISSQGGKYPLNDDQLQFLKDELGRLKPLRQAGQRAVLLATHHPPFSVDAKHGGTVGLSQDIDIACQAAGLWPDVVLSGHAHLYQRFTRRVANREIPYVICGSGGFSATPPMTKTPPAPYTQGDTTMEIDPVVEFGYLTLTVDMSAQAKQLTIAFNSTKLGANYDHVTVDLATNKIVMTKGPGTSQAKGRVAKSSGKTKVPGSGSKTKAPKTPARPKTASRSKSKPKK
jgi:Calcineurin-like phosphoesterase